MRNFIPKIPKEQLKHGAYYSGTCRNAKIARWNGEKERFYHFRTKFWEAYIEEIRCAEDFEGYDVFVVYEELLNPPFEIPFPKEKQHEPNPDNHGSSDS